jgi:hypothetical protein
MTTEYDKLYRVAGRLDIKARFNAKGVQARTDAAGGPAPVECTRPLVPSGALRYRLAVAVGELVARHQDRSRQHAFKRMGQVPVDQPTLVRHVGGKTQVPQGLQRLRTNPEHGPAEEIQSELTRKK